MKYMMLFLGWVFAAQAQSQELFSFTEPASNMAAGTIGFRCNATLMNDEVENRYNMHVLPEIMIGFSKKWMIHAEGFFSDRNNGIKAEGASVYAKYRFYSNDEVHRHFRMAAFGRLAFNNSDVHQEAIDLNGHNSGYELGAVATQLLHKVALSTSASLLHAMDNGAEAGFQFENEKREAINYTFSAGKLLLPKTYKEYKQTNLNAMFELLCQTNLNSGKSFVDAAPVLQLIFLSKMRMDLGYRLALVNDLYRQASKGYFVRIEYNIFNAL
jgi:hypothetical protein